MGTGDTGRWFYNNLNFIELADHIGDPTIADAILDRLVHNAHRILLKGGSIRRKQKLDEK